MRRVHVRYFAGAVLVVAACGIALWISAGRRAGVSGTTAPAARAENRQAAAPEADIAEGPVVEPAEIDNMLGDDILALDPLEDLDLVEEVEKQQRERFEKAKAALEEKLKLVKSLSQDEVHLLEHFIEEFGLSVETGWLAMMLADRYEHWEHYDEARSLYGRMMSEMPDGYMAFKQTAAFGLARMETANGNLEATEKILRDIMDSPVPDFMAERGAFEVQSFAVKKRIEAPLNLADVYRKQGRFAEARALLDDVITYALALPSNHTDFGNLPYHVGRAYRRRTECLLDEADEVELDDAMDTALGLIDGYAREFDGVALSEHSRDYMKNYQDHLRIVIANRACNRKIDFLFSRTADTDVDAAVEEAHALIDQYRTVYDGHQWHRQATADEFQRSVDWMEKRVARRAEEKRAGE